MADERVYEVEVCPECLTQRDAVSRSIGRCRECDSRVHPVTVRFRVARSAVLEQADPHRSLVERTVYFGCVGEAGHYYWLRGSGGKPYKARGPREISSSAFYKTLTPWGTSVDGGLFPVGADLAEGVAHVVHHTDGWTALGFTDRSVDSRGGSWSVYCIPTVLDGTEALAIAREAFPSIFARYTFDVRLAT